MFTRNFILNADSYKLSHFEQFPAGTNGMFSYIEARKPKDFTVFFGLQIFLKEYLSQPITLEMVNEAEAFAKAHGEPFNKAAWEYIINEYDGMIPVTIKAVKEGTIVPTGNVLCTIECTDPKVFWLATYIETALQRAIWYPTTIATNSYKARQIIKSFMEDTCDNLDGLPFKLHDFGGRGVSSEETAQLGGAAHLLSFMGSDTISGIRAANYYYNEPMAAFSVPAAEHSTMTSWGKDGETEAFSNMLDKFGKPGAIVSVVSDAYDIVNAIKTWGTTLKEKVLASGATLVIRPDSGDPVESVMSCLKEVDKYYGHTINTKGYAVLNNVRILQGDGIDNEMIQSILFVMKMHKWSADNVVFGSGGGLLQKVNRDTYAFAMKASAIRKTYRWEDGDYGSEFRTEWFDVFKDPVTDHGKKSKKGRLMLYRSNMTGEFMTAEDSTKYHTGEWCLMLERVYVNGYIFRDQKLSDIRKELWNSPNQN